MKKILALCTVLVTSTAIAEPADVPNTFEDGSPAVADEVNANFQSILKVLGGMKRQHLYQNSTLVGTAIIANVLKLDSSYLTIIEKFRGDSNIYIRENFDELYYEAGDCTGAPYTLETVEHDLAIGEVGALVAVQDQAYYQDFPAMAAPFNPLSVLKDGTCTGQSVSGFAKASTFTGGGGYCDGWALGNEFVRETNWYCETWDQFVSYGGLGWDYDAGDPVYPLVLNNPAVTGVTTQACTYASEPAVCLPNASLVSK